MKLLASGDGPAAIALFREILDESPDDAAAWDDVGWAVKEHDPAASLAYFDRALELDQRRCNAWIGRGMALTAPAESLRCFDEAIAIDPTSANAWFLKSCALDDLGRADAAAAARKRAGELDPAMFGGS